MTIIVNLTRQYSNDSDLRSIIEEESANLIESDELTSFYQIGELYKMLRGLSEIGLLDKLQFLFIVKKDFNRHKSLDFFKNVICESAEYMDIYYEKGIELSEAVVNTYISGKEVYLYQVYSYYNFNEYCKYNFDQYLKIYDGKIDLAFANPLRKLNKQLKLLQKDNCSILLKAIYHSPDFLDNTLIYKYQDLLLKGIEKHFENIIYIDCMQWIDIERNFTFQYCPFLETETLFQEHWIGLEYTIYLYDF